jgi:hypothetical protein
MPIQESTFSPLPAIDEVREALTRQRQHVTDLRTYVCYLIPLARRFGDAVYEIAATALAEGGLDVTDSALSEIARDFASPGGAGRYREARLAHTAQFLTSCKGAPPAP